MRNLKSEDSPSYSVAPQGDDIIRQALAILESRIKIGDALTSPGDVKNYLRLRLAPHDREVFAVVLLDAQHRVLECVELFAGTLTQTSVYPREVVKLALTRNAAAVILSHNHPSGSAEPSRADEFLTQTLKAALALVDVRVLDHVVVSALGSVSLAERGLL